MSKRIQRKRTKGWRMPEDAIYVGRKTRWGNPYTVTEHANPAEAVDFYKSRLSIMFMGMTKEEQKAWLAPLVGKDLVCWCPLDQSCHADILLELAYAMGN